MQSSAEQCCDSAAVRSGVCPSVLGYLAWIAGGLCGGGEGGDGARSLGPLLFNLTTIAAENHFSSAWCP